MSCAICHDLSRGGAEIGLIERPDQVSELLIVGGYFDGDYKDTSLLLDLETLLWRPGPNIDAEIENLASVQRDGTLILNGGHYGNLVFYDGILEYNKYSETWIRHSGNLENPRCVHQSVIVPGGYFECDD